MIGRLLSRSTCPMGITLAVLTGPMLAASVALGVFSSAARANPTLAPPASSYAYDSGPMSTTPTANSRIEALIVSRTRDRGLRSSGSLQSTRRATKAPDEAAGGVYSLRDETGNVMRTGRSKDLARRRGEHARDSDLSRYEFRPEFRTDDYGTQRGLEQLLHEQLIPPLNKINPISPRNPRRGGYIRSAEDFLGGGR